MNIDIKRNSRKRKNSGPASLLAQYHALWQAEQPQAGKTYTAVLGNGRKFRFRATRKLIETGLLAALVGLGPITVMQALIPLVCGIPKTQ